jgi:RNA polymerase sigma factor (sigma-70 family)
MPAASTVMDSAKDKPAFARDDKDLVRQCLAGSEEAWSLLIDKYKALIYSIPIKYGTTAADAADVFQATCLELLARLPELREPRALPKWLMEVAHHQCYRWKQQSQRVVSRDSDPDLPEPEIPAIAESLVQQTEEEQMLRQAMASLEGKCRRLIELLFLEAPSRPYAEVAQELGLAVGTIGSARQRCIEKLRDKLQGLGFE